MSNGQVTCRCRVVAASLLCLIVTTLGRYLGAPNPHYEHTSTSGSVHQKRIGDAIVVVYIQQQLYGFLWFILVEHTRYYFCNRLSTYTLHAKELVCVLYIKRFFLLVEIQHTQCPRRFLVLERYQLRRHKTTIQAATLYQVDSSSTMACHCAGL